MSEKIETDITQVLVSSDKKVREASDILSRMYRTILSEGNVGWQRWNTLLTQHLDRVYGDVPVSMDKITNDRGNLRKALGSPTMTWAVFCRGVQILAPENARIKIALWWESTDITIKTGCDLLSEEPIEGPTKLAGMFQQICGYLGKDHTNLSSEIDLYLDNPAFRVKTNGRQRGNDKGNLKRELGRDDIMFDVFKKGLRVLAPSVVYFEVALEWSNGRKTTHKLRVNSP